MYCIECGHKKGGHVHGCSLNISVENSAITNQSTAVPQKGKGLAISLIVIPPVLLIFILAAWGIMLYVIGASSDTNEGQVVVGQIINVFLGLVAFIAVIAWIPCTIVGIILLGNQSLPLKETNISKLVPSEITRWNWGAAFLSPFWGMYFRVWESFLVFVPVLNIGYWIYLGFRGNAMAWKRSQWKSVEEFQQAQQPWNTAGIIIFSITVVFYLLVALGAE